jgi:hypothetical protein
VIERPQAELLTARQGEEHANSKTLVLFDCHIIPCSAQGTKEPESSEEEPNPSRTNSLRHGCFLFGPNSEPNSAEIPRIEY